MEYPAHREVEVRIGRSRRIMPLEAHCDRFVLKCGLCSKELTKLGRTAPLIEAAAAGWGLIVEPNGMYDYACSACLAMLKVKRDRMPEVQLSATF